MAAPASKASDLDPVGEQPSPAESIRNAPSVATTSDGSGLLEVLRDLGATMKRLEERIIADCGTLGTATLARGKGLEEALSQNRIYTPETSEKVSSGDCTQVEILQALLFECPGTFLYIFGVE
jgi:hypothetical protein